MDSDAWDARYAASELVWSAGPNRLLVAEAAGLEPGRALDVACGEGRNAIWLAEQGWEVTGVDFSPVAVDKARRLAEARGVTVRWMVGDVVHEPLPQGPFDLVAVLYLQLPAAARRKALAASAAVLAPGGTLLVIGHDSTNIAAGWGGPQDPEVLYGPDDVIADVGALEIVKAERVDREVTTDDGPRTAIDVVVRAVRPA